MNYQSPEQIKWNEDKKFLINVTNLKTLMENIDKSLLYLEDIKCRINDCEITFNRKTEDLNILLKEINDKDNELTSIKNNFEQTSKFIKSEIDSLEEKNNSSINQLKIFTEEIDSKKNNIKELDIQISVLEKTKQNIDNLSGVKSTIESEIDILNKNKVSLSGEIEPLQSKVSEYKEQVSSLIKKINDLTIVLEEKGNALDIINAMIKVRMKRESVKQMKDIIDENYGKI